MLQVHSDRDQNFTIDQSETDKTIQGLMCDCGPKSIEYLPTNVYRVFPKLISFLFYSCDLSTVERIHVKSVTKLIHLSLPGNNIEHVSADAFVDLVSLRYLILSDNQIECLAENTFKSLKKLEGLVLNGNHIKNLQPQIFHSLAKVTTILLGDNQLEKLDDNIFAHLHELKWIQLDWNRIETIQQKLFSHNMKLEGISFFHNEHKIIEDTFMFNYLPNLKYVDLTLEDECSRLKNYTSQELDQMREDFNNYMFNRQASCPVEKVEPGTDYWESESDPSMIYPDYDGNSNYSGYYYIYEYNEPSVSTEYPLEKLAKIKKKS